MTTTPNRLVFFFLLVLFASIVTGCKKDKTEPPVKFRVAAALQGFDVKPRYTVITYDVSDLLVGGTSIYVSTGPSSSFSSEVNLSDNVPYSFTLAREVYVAGGTTTTTNTGFTGTIAKALFINSDNPASPNQFKIDALNNTPTLSLNGVRLPAPAGGGTGTGGSGNTCPLGTWQMPTCNGTAGKYLVYNFGPGGVGYSENPDCNGICSSLKYNFTYSVSGNTITYTFTSVDPVTCNVTIPQPALPSPAGPYSITYTCGNNGNQLVTEAVNIRTGVVSTFTFTRR